MAVVKKTKASDLQSSCKKLVTLLKKHYKPTGHHKHKLVLETMLHAVCLENSTPELADESFERLTKTFQDYNEVRVSTFAELTPLFEGQSDPDTRAARIRSILQRFPKARLVWMSRDPVQVLMSNRKMWSAMFATHGLTQPVPGALDDFLRDALDAAAQTLAWCADKLPPERLVVVAHEALLARPADVVDDIGERLQLPRASSRNALHVALDHVRRGRVERYSQATPAPAEVACSALDAVHRIALASRHAIR